jgi:hypothetical protein
VDSTLGPLYIVAGNRQEFDDFVIRKRMMGHSYDFRYVWSREVIVGLSIIRGFYVGSYKEREDWPEIELAIRIIKSRGG